MFQLFYLFVLIFSCFGVIWPKNRIYNLLSLVSVFGLMSVNLMALGLDFMGLLVVFMYVGAICMLFLFVLMFMEVSFLEVYSFSSYFNWFLFYLVLLALCFTGVYAYGLSIYNSSLFVLNSISFLSSLDSVHFNSNLFQLGLLFYSDYSLGFLLCAFILLISMVSVILMAFLFK